MKRPKENVEPGATRPSSANDTGRVMSPVGVPGGGVMSHESMKDTNPAAVVCGPEAVSFMPIDRVAASACMAPVADWPPQLGDAGVATANAKVSCSVDVDTWALALHAPRPGTMLRPTVPPSCASALAPGLTAATASVTAAKRNTPRSNMATSSPVSPREGRRMCGRVWSAIRVCHPPRFAHTPPLQAMKPRAHLRRCAPMCAPARSTP